MTRKRPSEQERYAAALERLVYTSPDQIRWIHKSEAHLAAEAALVAKQAAERGAGEAQPSHPANRD